MRIAQIAPLHESVPPSLYGGTERIVHYLTEELVRQGHEVTLFASGDSRTSANLVACCGSALRLADCPDPVSQHLIMAERVFARAVDFDIIHSHIDYLAFPAARRHPAVPCLTTLHGRLDLPDLQSAYREFREMPLVSISADQRRPLPDASWLGCVHHGLPRGIYPFQGKPGSYLAFLGRISPEKRPDLAIGIARRAGVPLKMAAKVSRHETDYFNDRIRPLLGPDIEFVGEIGEAEKGGFLGGALALLLPLDWPEPFGMVMIEAMACGTPVIAFRRGSVPEIIETGVTGFAVEDEDAAVAAVAQVGRLRRGQCRAAFERRFTADRMARDYLDLYDRLGSALDSGRMADGEERHHAGHHNGRGQVLHPARLVARREADPGAQAWRDLRHL